MKEYIDKNRSRFQDRYTLTIMACAVVAPEFMVCMAKKHFDGLAEEFNNAMDVVELRHIFIAMAGDVYLQALTEQYLMEVQYRDKETGRQRPADHSDYAR